MSIIKAPVSGYTGISAGVRFEKGIGHTDDPAKIEWFRKKGYIIEDKEQEAKTETEEKISEKSGEIPETEDGVSGKKSTRETAKTTKKDG